MRLINADKLKEKFKEHYDFFMSAYKNEQNMNSADRSRIDEILNSIAEVINAPTVCDIDVIKAEIDKQAWSIAISNTDRANGMWDAYRIIDKYIGNEE